MAEPDPSFAYLNARVRSLKGALFTRARIEELLHQNDLARMTEALLDSPYRQEMAEALTRASGADAIEDAVTRNLYATMTAVLNRATGRPRELLVFYLTRWDLIAVKSLIRARHREVAPEDAGDWLVPGACISPALMRRFAEAPGMDALIAQLAAWNPDLCGALPKAYAVYRESGDPAVLDEALDQSYFVAGAARLRDTRDEAGQMLSFFLQLAIDRINLRIVFERLRVPGAPPLDLSRFLVGGTLSRTLLGRLSAAADAADAAEALESTRYAGFVEGLGHLLQTGRFGPVERLSEQVLMRELRRLSVRDPLGLAVAMDYTWRKFNEGTNLRLVARGLAGHLPPGRVREELVFV